MIFVKTNYIVISVSVALAVFLVLFALGVIDFSLVVMAPLIGCTLHVAIDVLIDSLRRPPPPKDP